MDSFVIFTYCLCVFHVYSVLGLFSFVVSLVVVWDVSRWVAIIVDFGRHGQRPALSMWLGDVWCNVLRHLYLLVGGRHCV